MKQKKSYGMRARKRKSFTKVYLGKWLRVMTVCGLFGICCLAFFTIYMKNEQVNEFYSQENIRVNGIKDTEEEEISNFARQQMLKGAIEAEARGIASVVYETDTKKQIAGCEEQIFIPCAKTEETPIKIYSYPTEEIPGWTAYRDRLMENKENDRIYYENIDMPYCYISGDEMLPGKFAVTVTSFDWPDFENEREVSESSLDSTFEELQYIPEGFEKQIIGEDRFTIHPVIVGYSTTSPCKIQYPCMDTSYEVMLDTYQRVKEGENEWDSEDKTAFTVTLVSFRTQELCDGRRVTLLSCMHYDVWKVWGKRIGMIAAAVVVLGSLLALVLAKISHARLQAQYNMEDYRKNLMNTMAHDLKSPLMSISGYAENLENHMLPEKQAHYAKEIQENVQYMNRIIESVLELSKVENEGVCLKKETIDMAALLDEVQNRYELQLKGKNLKVISEGALTLQADKGLMLQVTDNLLGNAIKYATPGSTVQVTLNNDKFTMTNLCETDLSDVVDKLTKPFVVGSESRSGKTGSGLGLAIVKNICELHGYQLQVEYKSGQFSVQIICR